MSKFLSPPNWTASSALERYLNSLSIGGIINVISKVDAGEIAINVQK